MCPLVCANTCPTSKASSAELFGLGVFWFCCYLKTLCPSNPWLTKCPGSSSSIEGTQTDVHSLHVPFLSAAPFTPEIPSISEPGKVPDPVTDAKSALDAARRQRANESSDFMDVMAFSGIGPELINGRLAMLGFVAAIGAELATGTPVVQQYAQAPYLIAATFVTIIGASLIPLLLGNKNRVSVGPWTPTAEVWNGRTAMVGFAALLITEAYFGRALL
eukprot:356031-Chlamydomonas_euryale.AAC.8